MHTTTTHQQLTNVLNEHCIYTVTKNTTIPIFRYKLEHLGNLTLTNHAEGDAKISCHNGLGNRRKHGTEFSCKREKYHMKAKPRRAALMQSASQTSLSRQFKVGLMIQNIN